jgi:hypothetical protein
MYMYALEVEYCDRRCHPHKKTVSDTLDHHGIILVHALDDMSQINGGEVLVFTF